MRLMYRSIACTLTLITYMTSSALAQTIDITTTPLRRPALSVGLNVGLNQLYGDLSSPNIRPAFGLQLSYPISRVVSLNLLGDLGTLSAQESAFYNSVAKTAYVQAALGGAVNVTRLFSKLSSSEQAVASNGLSVYVALGLISFDATAYSLTTNHIQRYTNGTGSHRTQSDNETAIGDAGVASTHEVVMPIGLRYNRSINARLSLYGDLRYNIISTDKLDATFDKDNSTINTPNGGDIYGKIPSGNSRDSWASLSLGLSYRFGNR